MGGQHEEGQATGQAPRLAFPPLALQLLRCPFSPCPLSALPLMCPSIQAIDLEAVCKARQHGVTVPPNGKKGWWAELRWGYKCLVRPWVLRAMAAAAAAASAVVVWSEVTIGSGRSPDLSPFSLMVGGWVGVQWGGLGTRNSYRWLPLHHTMGRTWLSRWLTAST